MNEIKQKALDKMNQEMSKAHSDTEDYIHNWLCEQEDDELFECILKDGKSISDSLSYLTKKAKEGSKNSQSAVMSDAEGFRIIVEYFKGKETSVKSYGVVSNKPITSTVDQKQVKKVVEKDNAKKEVKKEVKDASPLMSIFDFGLDDVIENIEEQDADVDEEVEDDEEL